MMNNNSSTNQNNIQLFKNQPIRSAWDAKKEEWLFSIIDVVRILTGVDNPRRYWSDLKRKLKEEGNETYEKIVQLKLKAEDGKNRLTDVATTEQLLRIIQSIPSKKAEPFKLWLAEVGRERLEETADPEKIAERGGNIAGAARKNLESQLGESIITNKTAKELNHTDQKYLS